MQGVKRAGSFTWLAFWFSLGELQVIAIFFGMSEAVFAWAVVFLWIG
jgi:hypothetical protein